MRIYKSPFFPLFLFFVLIFSQIQCDASYVTQIQTYYQWQLDKILAKKNATIGLCLTNWLATNGYDADVADLRFELTLAVFAEAYKITSNETYLQVAYGAFDAGVNYCFCDATKLFATRFNRFKTFYKDQLDVTWAGILLNAMFDFYGLTLNETHLQYASYYADALYNYAINKTSWIPYGVINVTDGTVITGESDYPMESGRLIGGYIKGYEVTGNATYIEIAKNLTSGFWNKRHPSTNLVPLAFNGLTGLATVDYNKPNYDPIQNVLLYAYDRTNDAYFLDIAVALTDAQLNYGWYNNRLVQSIYTNGNIRYYHNDLTDGSSLYITGLAQLYYITKETKYLTYAKEYWNTLYNCAKVNGTYTTEISINNVPNDKADLYCQHMHVQGTAILYHVEHNQTYINDIINTVNNFWNKFKRDYGTVCSINLTSGAVIDGGAYDWLDSSSYIFGSAICFFQWYPQPEQISVNGDIFYYMPYYPMFKGISTSINPPTSYSQLTFDTKPFIQLVLTIAILMIIVKLLGG